MSRPDSRCGEVIRPGRVLSHSARVKHGNGLDRAADRVPLQPGAYDLHLWQFRHGSFLQGCHSAPGEPPESPGPAS